MVKKDSKLSYKVGIMTLGCKVNQYESKAIAEEFERHGFKIGRFSEKCGVYVINTCTVTAESDRKTRQMIRRAARHNPSAYVLVTGCYAQMNPGKTAGIDGVDYIVGNSNKLKLVDAAIALVASGTKNHNADVKVENITDAEFEPMCITSSERTRAYVKIEDGCDNHCTYCIVPHARGNVRSKAPEDVISEVKGLLANGYREVVLTGIETASYGKDLRDGYRLIDLLEEVDKLPGIERIRLGSLDPSVLKEDFAERIAKLSHFAPNFHLSMQAGGDNTLRAMKRKYSRQMALDYIENLKKLIPDVTFCADIIVGFPGESEEDFEETVDFVRKVGFTHLHIFPYSKRAGTVAAEMDGQLPEEVKNARLEKLSLVQKECVYAAAEKYIGQVKKVLFETFEEGKAVGHTPDFLQVSVITDTELDNQIKEVKLVSFDGESYNGFIL